jgi:hypothetical protein
VELRLLQAGIPYSALESADEGKVWRWYEVLTWTRKKDRDEQQAEIERMMQIRGG